MVVSELQSRLEHLVTYSSQLIFISGDSIASQQRSVQSFIAQQSDSTEIAFINAEARLSLADYRQQITTQLLGPNRARTARPLNELLAPLNEHDGPILIFICQAEHLPRPVLQELWELVLQSRFAGNRQHLNVLLFGESTWAEEAKAWLPANNREKPLLLSTESVSASPPPASELDQLIAQKRADFERRLSDREQQTYVVPDKAKKWPLILMASLSFVALFGAAMTWLYQDQVSALWWELTRQAPASIEQDTTLPVPEAEEEAVELTNKPDTIPQPTLSVEQTEVTNSGVGEQQTTSVSQPLEAEDSATGQQLVTSWQDAVERIPDPAEVFKEVTDDADNVELASVTPPPQFDEPNQTLALPSTMTVKEANEADAPESVNDIGVTESQNTASLTTEDDVPVSNSSEATEDDGYDVVDYPVEDIVSVAQLPDASDAQSRSGSPEQDTFLNTVPELPSQQYVIQVAGLSDQQLLDEFLTDNNLKDKVWIYRTLRQSQPWFVVLVNQSFDNRSAALQASESLPPAMQTGTPFIKSAGAVKDEMARTNE